MKKTFALFALLILLTSVSRLSAQNLNAYLLQLHTVGCDNQSGILYATATGGTGNYTYQWSNGSTNDTAYNLPAGTHTVTVYSGSDSAAASVTLQPFGIDTVQVYHACNGGNGLIYLDNITATYPLTFHWYQNAVLLNETTAELSNIPAGNYAYALIDAQGCIDSGTVEIIASSPQMSVTLSDSSLCYGASALAWYTPGFTLFDNWGGTYNTSTDTLTYMNSMGAASLPTIGMDSLGCLSNEINPFPFVFLQSHPDPIPLFQIGDTVSASFTINPNPSTTLTYNWYFDNVLVYSGPYSYLPIDSSGYVSVSAVNIYGCSNFGSLQAVITQTGVGEKENFGLTLVGNNPALVGASWFITMQDLAAPIPFLLYDVSGRIIHSATLKNGLNTLATPAEPGLYILDLGRQKITLIAGQ